MTGLDYANYTVFDSGGSPIANGLLEDLGAGLFRFSDSGLNDSSVGEYDVVIWLFKHNYVNHTVTFVATY